MQIRCLPRNGFKIEANMLSGTFKRRANAANSAAGGWCCAAASEQRPGCGAAVSRASEGLIVVSWPVRGQCDVTGQLDL